MLPVPPYKPGKYPPSNLFPRFGDSGTIPPQFRQQNEHLQAMIARRKASTQLLADRAPPQAERPGGEQYYDAQEEEPQLPAQPGELDDMPPLEEVPAQMPGRPPPPEPGPEREAEPVREGQGIFRNVMQGVGFGAFHGARALYHGTGAVGVGLYHIGAGMAHAAQQVNNYEGGGGRSPSPQPVPQAASSGTAWHRIDTPPDRNTSASASSSSQAASSTQVPRPRAGRRSPPPRPDPNTSASSFSGSHRGPSWI
jgi:hypothetical protein